MTTRSPSATRSNCKYGTAQGISQIFQCAAVTSSVLTRFNSTKKNDMAGVGFFDIRGLDDAGTFLAALTADIDESTDCSTIKVSGNRDTIPKDGSSGNVASSGAAPSELPLTTDGEASAALSGSGGNVGQAHSIPLNGQDEGGDETEPSGSGVAEPTGPTNTSGAPQSCSPSFLFSIGAMALAFQFML